MCDIEVADTQPAYAGFQYLQAPSDQRTDSNRADGQSANRKCTKSYCSKRGCPNSEALRPDGITAPCLRVFSGDSARSETYAHRATGFQMSYS